MSPTYGYVTKLFVESEFQHKGTKQTNKREFQQILRVSWQEQIQKIKSIKCYTEKNKIIFGQNCHHKDRNLPLKPKL